MPPATSPSAIAWISSGCRPVKAEIWSNVRVVFSTSQTAVALGISTCRHQLILLRPDIEAGPGPANRKARLMTKRKRPGHPGRPAKS